ncbi:MAG: fumarylacetoacetate hydrolase family protein [Clostridiales bacterium]|nr:fumarylacetoacetate hydrolase family protein [Clostridiales bacterium]
MKYLRFNHNDKPVWASLEGDTAKILSAAPYNGGERTGETVPLDGIKLLAPCEPEKIVAVGKNYFDHIKEIGGDDAPVPETPILFIKPPSAIIGPEDNIMYPEISERVDHEAELAFIMKKDAKNVKAENALEYILGYTCLNDVTARDIQRKDGQWTRAKSFDTFAPVGPIVTDEVDPSDLHVECRVNGEVRQSSSTSCFMWKISELVEFITSCMTLKAGDVVTTGTPSGISPLNRGDKVEIELEGIGILTNYIV